MVHFPSFAPFFTIRPLKIGAPGAVSTPWGDETKPLKIESFRFFLKTASGGQGLGPWNPDSRRLRTLARSSGTEPSLLKRTPSGQHALKKCCNYSAYASLGYVGGQILP